MTSPLKPDPLSGRSLGEFGLARVRDLAFDAVRKLWRQRQAEGLTQKEVARRIARDPAWVSKNLKAPGNWTLKTFGELVQALDGEAEINVYALESTSGDQQNSDAYSGYLDDPAPSIKSVQGAFTNALLLPNGSTEHRSIARTAVTQPVPGWVRFDKPRVLGT